MASELVSSPFQDIRNENAYINANLARMQAARARQDETGLLGNLYEGGKKVLADLSTTAIKSNELKNEAIGFLLGHALNERKKMETPSNKAVERSPVSSAMDRLIGQSAKAYNELKNTIEAVNQRENQYKQDVELIGGDTALGGEFGRQIPELATYVAPTWKLGLVGKGGSALGQVAKTGAAWGGADTAISLGLNKPLDESLAIGAVSGLTGGVIGGAARALGVGSKARDVLHNQIADASGIAKTDELIPNMSQAEKYAADEIRLSAVRNSEPDYSKISNSEEFKNLEAKDNAAFEFAKQREGLGLIDEAGNIKDWNELHRLHDEHLATGAEPMPIGKATEPELPIKIEEPKVTTSNMDATSLVKERAKALDMTPEQFAKSNPFEVMVHSSDGVDHLKSIGFTDRDILSKNVKGMFQQVDNKSLVHIFKNGDMSTLHHEVGHFFESTLTSIEKNKFNELFGHIEEPIAKSEAFANGFESYLSGNTKGLSKQELSMFGKFKQWIKETIDNLFKNKQTMKELSPEMREFYGAILGRNDSISKLTKKVNERVSKESISLRSIGSRVKAKEEELIAAKAQREADVAKRAEIVSADIDKARAEILSRNGSVKKAEAKKEPIIKDEPIKDIDTHFSREDFASMDRASIERELKENPERFMKSLESSGLDYLIEDMPKGLNAHDMSKYISKKIDKLKQDNPYAFGSKFFKADEKGIRDKVKDFIDNLVSSVEAKLTETPFGSNLMSNSIKDPKQEAFRKLVSIQKNIVEKYQDIVNSIKKDMTAMFKEKGYSAEQIKDINRKAMDLMRIDFSIIRDLDIPKFLGSKAVKSIMADKATMEKISNLAEALLDKTKFNRSDAVVNARQLVAYMSSSTKKSIMTKGDIKTENELIDTVDKLVSVKALENNPELSKFVDEFGGEKWFKETMKYADVIRNKSKELFSKNWQSYRKGYMHDSYNPASERTVVKYVQKGDDPLNKERVVTKEANIDEQRTMGAFGNELEAKTKGTDYLDSMEVESVRAKLEKEGKTPDEIEKIFNDLADEKGLQVMRNDKGEAYRIIENTSDASKREFANMTDDLAESLAKTAGSISKKSDFKKFYKDIIDISESWQLASKTEKDGMRLMTKEELKTIPHELREAFRYVDKNFADRLLSQSEALYSDASNTAKIFTRGWKEVIQMTKRNLVQLNPMAFLGNYVSGHGIYVTFGGNPATSVLKQKEGSVLLNESIKLREEIATMESKGLDKTPEYEAKMKELNDNRFYQMEQKGLSISTNKLINDGSGGKNTYLGTVAKEQVEKYFGKENGSKIVSAFNKVMLKEGTHYGDKAMEFMGKIDAMGRYALVDLLMSQGHTMEEAIAKANGVFGDANIALPKFVRMLSETGAVPFAGWAWSVMHGSATMMKENLFRTILVAGFMEATQQVTGVRTQSMNPTTQASSFFEMITTTPMAHPSQYLIRASTPRVFGKTIETAEHLVK